MTAAAVHWHEGMFLRPQHFQAGQRNLAHMAARNAKWDQHYNWGLRSIEIDTDALSNYRFLVRSLQARLRDGMTVSIPDDGVLPDFDLKDAIAGKQHVTIYLAVPLLQLTRANINRSDAVDDVRYTVATQELEDENTGLNPQPIQVRLTNFKLLAAGHDQAGYETLPLARIKRADRAEATPELDESYIPPLLACDAWKPLETGLLQQIYDRIGKKVEFLSSQITSRGITFDSAGQGDQRLFEQLRVMNETFAPLGVRCFAQGQHPFDMYLELSRLVGQLAIFGAQRRPPQLPRYDHDDLGACFWRIKQQVDALLDIVVEPEYKERPFVGAGMRLQVALESSWLEGNRRIFLGVQSPQSAEDCNRLLTRGLDMKIGSSDRVDEIFRQGRAGLRFSYCSHPPRSLPSLPGLTYFQIEREANTEWDQVERSLSLAVRLNENLIVSNIQGQRALTIRVGGQTTSLQFTLYVTSEQ
ncbi:type VI secretion system baseplate subunit TssK [Lignipirellula cremea]|uniref:Type VI secretion system baseplate subunit TssK n=1 Tax=Lignipirellula cremea TaxID=2528010 RepID=A0A518DTI2_9BACT|nr:type VI secretion system baseplate subunit TssK [Lignipirellula cremea]QDU95152.1 hypothetical protein Pla8534_29640 [Lignipirellula cremea]